MLIQGLHALPRVAVPVFIELMAGFFLKQYRTAMGEHRYFEAIQRYREATLTAFLLRRDSKDDDALKDPLHQAARDSECRRFVAGATTAAIETQKLQENEMAKMVTVLRMPAVKLKK